MAHAHDKHDAHGELVARLRRQALEVKRLASGLEEAALATPTVPGKWSLKELVCHLRRMDGIFKARVDRMLADDNPAVQRYDPDADPEFARLTTQPTATLVQDYLDAREAFCRQLDRLTPAEWHRKGRHPEFTHYDIHFQVDYMAHHEAHHIYQMFQRRAPLGKMPH